MLTQKCNVCKQVLPLSEFRSYKNRSGDIRYRAYCRDCERKKGRERYEREKTQMPDNYRFIDFYKKTKRHT